MRVSPSITELVESWDGLLRTFAKAVFAGEKDCEWAYLERKLIPDLETKNWEVARVLQRLKKGERDVDILTYGLDASTTALFERLCELVENAEKLKSPPNATSSPFGVAVSSAISSCNFNELKFLLELGWSIDKTLDNVSLSSGTKGLTALHYAALVGSKEAVSLVCMFLFSSQLLMPVFPAASFPQGRYLYSRRWWAVSPSPQPLCARS